MIVVCIEGSHGIGKTTLTKGLVEDGFSVIREDFMPEQGIVPLLHPKTFTHEMAWISEWAQRVIDNFSAKREIVFSDRCPISTWVYDQQNREILKQVSTKVFDDLKAIGIFIVVVKLVVDEDINWSRIRDRLVKEPYRCSLGEDSRFWLREINKEYEAVEGITIRLEPASSVSEVRDTVLLKVSELFGIELQPRGRVQ